MANLDFLLWGDKTLAFFDVWSIEHFFAGMCLAGNVSCIDKLSNKFLLPIQKIPLILLVAFMWEPFEHYMEEGLLGYDVAYWLHGVEFWGNRLITDPLMVICGATLYFRYKYAKWVGMTFSSIWLTVNIFYYPHSMYLQDVLSQ